jgi:predicted nucleotidyltransferase
MKERIPIDKEALAAVCRRHGIRRLALFGSVVRPDFTSQSDVDALVDFHADRVPSLFTLPMIIEDLERLFGRNVDLVTYQSLTNPYRRASILEDEAVQYDEAS